MITSLVFLSILAPVIIAQQETYEYCYTFSGGLDVPGKETVTIRWKHEDVNYFNASYCYGQKYSIMEENRHGFTLFYGDSSPFDDDTFSTTHTNPVESPSWQVNYTTRSYDWETPLWNDPYVPQAKLYCNRNSLSKCEFPSSYNEWCMWIWLC